MILIQGIDSSGSCGRDEESKNSYQARATAVKKALSAAGAQPLQIVGFSYSGQYADSFTCHPLTIPEALARNSIPIYKAADTCAGVEAASVRLGEMVRTALAGDALDVVIVGHSMGGVVASYYAATADQRDLEKIFSNQPSFGLPVLRSKLGGHEG